MLIAIATIAATAAIAALIAAAIAMRLACLAIERVSFSRASRLDSARSASQTRENRILSLGTTCEPESIIRTDSSPMDSNSARQPACLGSTDAIHPRL